MGKNIYVERLIDKNVGPLSDITIDFPMLENGDPKPVILVGENGAGKSTLLSNIVDAFFEMAGRAFDNANYPNERTGYQYFKAIVPSEINNNGNFLLSYISFKGENNPKYYFKAGNLLSNDAKRLIGEENSNINWKEDDSLKIITADKDTVTEIWGDNVLCYFGPDRYEKPAWMGDKYYQTDEYLHPTAKAHFNGKLKNPILVQNVTSANLQWLLDVIADSRADIEGDLQSMKLAPSTNPNNLLLLKQARNNLENILSKILGEDVCFQLNYRNQGGSRFRIVKKDNNNLIVCPTLDSLSTGQIALFNIFATIVRYADNNNIDQSINLGDITGIVIIDEIELHLHSRLQNEVLPELIKMFPKIQFVISSQAPLFLLGMKKTFGIDGFDVYDLPSGKRINIEHFSEFSKAYDYIKETERFQKEISNIAENMPKGEKPLLITEGSTDWKHMKVAYSVLSKVDKYKNLFDNLHFEFLEYEPKNSSSDALLKIEMGNRALIPLCESMAKIPHERKYIIIADRDTEDITKKLSGDGINYKKWGNNTFSVVLPIPANRINTPNICIEHYYSDEEIEKEIEIEGIKRHLFMGKDFNSRGCNLTQKMICERKELCGKGKINIIDGTQGERVYNLFDDEDKTNYAITKSGFVDYVCSHKEEFDFSNFTQLFEVIKTIIEVE